MEPVQVQTGGAGLFSAALDEHLKGFARAIEPSLERLDLALRRRLKSATPAIAPDPRQLKAFALITSGAAARLISAGHTTGDYFEQVSYNSRRLAKLNVPPAEVVEALADYDRDVDLILARDAAGQTLYAARQELHYRTVLAVNNAYYQVREAETQAFYGLLGAEMDAKGLDDLLHRFIVILTRTFQAQSGRLIVLPKRPTVSARLLKRLARPAYIVSGGRGEELIVDSAMRGAYQSYWSIPFFENDRLTGLIQLGFSIPYRWLPRELDLLRAFAARCIRAAERARLMEELAARGEQVRALAAHLLQAEEEERRRISREVHDEAGQSMLFLRLHLEMLEKAAPPELRPKVAEARSVTERIIAEIRRLIGALSPSVVEEMGLPAAIRHLSARFRKLYPMKLRLRLSRDGRRLSREIETTVYRVVQECYQNIAKYSGASSVNLSLRSTDKLLELKVEDDGVGFDVDSAVAQPKCFGLKGMRERVALLGGQLEIRSSPGHGSAIIARIPGQAAALEASSGDEHDHGNSNASDR